MKLPTTTSRGQVLPIALAVLLILTIFVPLMVFYSQRDASWAVKQSENTHAFHLAEAGVEKAFLDISLSTVTWLSLMNGTPPTGYQFDKSYTDINGGTYSVSITSGPSTQEATVISVGRDALKKETRSLKVVYANSLFGNIAVYGGTGVQVSGGVTVEWGAIMSPDSLSPNCPSHCDWPQMWSASSITGLDTDPNPPNCDSPNCVQWHSYYPSIPPAPTIDFDYYRSQAKLNVGGGCPSGGGAVPDGSCYYPGNAPSSWGNTTTGVVFTEGTFDAKKMFHTGTLIVMGNFTMENGNFGKGSPVMTMPTNAWKQYGSPANASDAWTHYLTFDTCPGVPAAFPGLNNTYTSCVVTKTGTKTAIDGLLYIGGNFSDAGGGGNGEIYGDLMVIGDVHLSAASGVTLFYNSGATSSLVTTSISLSRVSWQNASYGWPSGLP